MEESVGVFYFNMEGDKYYPNITQRIAQHLGISEEYFGEKATEYIMNNNCFKAVDNRIEMLANAI